MKNKKVIGVIVTYNRINLLKKVIKNLLIQDTKLEKIIIINNNSTDGTKEYLNKIKNKNIIIKHLAKNIGGSGGFSEGLKEATLYECDWIWMMDDDTIPEKDALYNLLQQSEKLNKIGFLCSKVLWKDRSIHKMNIPEISQKIHGVPFNNYEPEILISSCSFVSILINKKTVLEVGLPYKEFFIWGDDSEYSSRIIEKGYFGLYVPNSVVIHETEINYDSNILDDNKKNAWKHCYGIRNSLFRVRKKSIIKYFLKVIYNLVVLIPKIIILRKNKKVLFSLIVLKGTLKSIWFFPKIKKV